jgi:hypothetical protein
MGECRGCDWENVAPHALFTSNPDFRQGLKRLEMLLDAGVEAETKTLMKACGYRRIRTTRPEYERMHRMTRRTLKSAYFY